jgi:hypothetical protein
MANPYLAWRNRIVITLEQTLAFIVELLNVYNLLKKPTCPE